MASHKLTKESINQNVPRKLSGVYRLDRTSSRAEEPFITDYVGRSDSDLNDQLQKHIGKYTWYWCEYSTSPKAAFERECEMYHDYKPRDNAPHPARPFGSGWKCPRCRVLD
jgi:hypothetical protein